MKAHLPHLATMYENGNEDEIEVTEPGEAIIEQTAKKSKENLIKAASAV